MNSKVILGHGFNESAGTACFHAVVQFYDKDFCFRQPAVIVTGEYFLFSPFNIELEYIDFVRLILGHNIGYG